MAKFTENPNIHSFNELAYFKNLTSLDLHGDSNLAGSFDLTQHTKLTSVNVKNTKVAGLTFAEGAIIASIDYSPETTSIVLKSLSALTSVSADGAAKVVTLDIENCPNVDSIAVLKEVLTSPLTNVTLIGVNGTEVADAADVIYSLICKSGTHNLQGNIVVASVYNFLPDLINATTATSGVACIPSSGTSEAAFVIKYNGTTEPTVEAIGLSINESAASYNEGSVPSSIPNSVSANSTIFKNVNWSADKGSIDTNGNLSLSNAVAENNTTETDTSVVTATSIYNSAAKATRNVSVVRVGMSSITLSLDGDAPTVVGDTFTLKTTLDGNTTKPLSDVEFLISDATLVKLNSFDTTSGVATFEVIGEQSANVSIQARNKYATSVVSASYVRSVNTTVSLNGNDTFVAKNGNGSANYTFDYTPSENNSEVEIVSITSDNSAFVVSNATRSGFTLSVSGTSADQSATITAKIKVDGVEKTFTKSVTATYKEGIKYEAVDLGLPSGRKWANMNVGATKETDYGSYFQWGDIVGYGSNTSDGKQFNWANYKWCNGSNSTLTKYNTSSLYGTVDNKTTLESADDAAMQNMGEEWRMPDKADFDELINNTTVEWTTLNGVNGRKFTAKNGSGNYIFIPAGGSRINSSLNYFGSYGFVWSRSLNTGNPSNAWRLLFYSGNCSMSNDGRYYGFSVRGVQ